MKSLFKNSSLALLMMGTLITFNSSHAEGTTLKMECTLSDKMDETKHAGEAKDTFAPTTPNIYLVCLSDDLHQNDKVKFELIAENTNNVVPANYKILDRTVDVTAEMLAEAAKKESNINVNFVVTKPTKGWPVGSYRMDLFLNNEPTAFQSVKYTVK